MTECLIIIITFLAFISLISLDLTFSCNSLQEITLFAAVSGASTSCIPHNGGAHFISRPSQKLLSDISGVLQIVYNFPLSAALAAALRTSQIFVFAQL